MTGPGVFTVSLDTEMAWGSFDRDGIARYGDAYRRTPGVVEQLCAVFDDHEVPATWAFVGHLLDDCGGEHADLPTALSSWLEAAPCSTGVDRSLWYRPDLLETVQDCDTEQDVGLHGFSHLPLGDHGREAAAADLAAAVAAAEAAGLDPASFVFPRNRVGHVDLLAEHGLDVYRARDARWYERRAVPGPGRRLLRFADEAAGLTPPTVVPRIEDGVVALPGSQVLRTGQGAWRHTPDGIEQRRAISGLDRAAETGEVFHLWCHPFNVAAAPEETLSTLEAILEHADGLRERGALEVRTMRAVGAAAREGRWRTDARTESAGPEPAGRTRS